MSLAGAVPLSTTIFNILDTLTSTLASFSKLTWPSRPRQLRHRHRSRCILSVQAPLHRPPEQPLCYSPPVACHQAGYRHWSGPCLCMSRLLPSLVELLPLRHRRGGHYRHGYGRGYWHRHCFESSDSEIASCCGLRVIHCGCHVHFDLLQARGCHEGPEAV